MNLFDLSSYTWVNDTTLKKNNNIPFNNPTLPVSNNTGVGKNKYILLILECEVHSIFKRKLSINLMRLKL